MKNHILIEFNLTIYPQTRSLKKATLPKKILSLLKLPFVRKGLFMASESIEQQPLESIVSAQKSTFFFVDDAKLKSSNSTRI